VKKRLLRIAIAVLIGMALLTGAILGLIHTLGDHEALYEAKPVYFWIVQLTNQDLTASNHATLVLNENIIPRLTNVMFQDTNDSRLRIALIDKLNTLPHVNIYYTTASTRRGEAATTLGDLGPPARAAAPSLMLALKGKDLILRRAAAVSLGKIHAEPEVMIPLLITYLDDQNMDEAAADGLGEYGTSAKAAVPKLISLSTVRDKDLRHSVREALMKIDPEAAAQARKPQ
jgi:hypothetical protein